MEYRVELTARAARNLRQIYRHINAQHSPQAREWFNGLEALIASLSKYPERGTVLSKQHSARQLFYGKKPHLYRVIYTVNVRRLRVTVLHIRHGARDAFTSQGKLQ